MIQLTPSGVVRGWLLGMLKYWMQSSAKYCIGVYVIPPSIDFSSTAAFGGGAPKRMKMNIN